MKQNKQTVHYEVLTGIVETVGGSSGQSDTKQETVLTVVTQQPIKNERLIRQSEAQWAKVVYGDQITELCERIQVAETQHICGLTV